MNILLKIGVLPFGCYSFKDSLITALTSYINLVCFGRAVYTFSTSQFLTPSLPNGCCFFMQVVVESIFMPGAVNTLATSSVETLTCSNSWILTMDWPVSAPCSPLSLSGGNFNRFWNGSQSDSDACLYHPRHWQRWQGYLTAAVHPGTSQVPFLFQVACVMWCWVLNPCR